MKQLFFVLSIGCVLFVSCRQQINNTGTNPDTSSNKTDSLAETEEYEGLYFPSKPGSSAMLNVCFGKNHNLSYPVEDETNSLDSLYRKSLPNAYPYQTIYVKVKAELIAGGSQAAPYTLRINAVLKAEFKNYQNDCIPYEYWCMGNEPFWQIQISEKENLIDFYEPMEQKTIHFEYVKSQLKNEGIYYSTKNETNSIEIKIKKEKCSDGMTEKKYNYSAVVLLNDKNYSGCAIAQGETIE